MTPVTASVSFGPDIRGLHDWPPFFRIGFLQSAQGLGRPSFGRENLNSEIEEPRSHRWIGERARNGCVETANNLIRCALGREKSSPTGTRVLDQELYRAVESSFMPPFLHVRTSC